MTKKIDFRNYLHSKLDSDWAIECHKFNRGLALGVYRHDYQISSEAVHSSIPVTVQEAWFNAGKIEDPYKAFNAKKLAWMEQREWWYLNDFPTPHCTEDDRIYLRFEGITYRAEIWVNGVQVGRIEGMFRAEEFDVTDYLSKPGQASRVAIRVRSQENSWDDSLTAATKVRTQGPVAQNMYGWNWSARLVSIGIWQPISVLVKGPLRLEGVKAATRKVNLSGKQGWDAPKADATIEFEWLINNKSEKEKKVTVHYRLTGETFEDDAPVVKSVEVTVPALTAEAVSVSLNLEDAWLWWPNGYGKAELYRLNTTLESSDGILETNDLVFGIREISWRKNTDEDWVLATTGHTARPWAMVGEMYPWTLCVNGWPLFMKGSNWVMLDLMLRTESWRYDRQLRLARDAGVNYLRVWGGSLAETEAFYDLCDRYGILCWQEFWLACGNYPAMDHQVFLENVESTVKRLINRTCLTHYCGGNEYHPDNPENKVLVDKIEKLVCSLDPVRGFRRGSPYKGDRHGGLVMTPLVTRNKYLDVLYGESRIVLMRSEVATGRSLPMLSSLEKFVPEESLWPIDELFWRDHWGVPAEFMGFAHEYNAEDSFTHAAIANHLSHAQLCRLNMEFCRTRMFSCSGNLNWQFNVPWPCMHREIVDTWGVPKPGFYYHSKACQHLLLSVDFERYLWHPGETLSVPVFAVSDLESLNDLKATITIFRTDLSQVYSKIFEFEISAASSLKLGNLDFEIPPRLAEDALFVMAELEQDQNILFRNIYWFAVSNHEEPACKIDLCGKWNRSDGTALELPGSDLSIKNPSFEFIMLKDGAQLDLESQSGLEEGQVNGGDSHYLKTFQIPSDLKGQNLEFYTAGFESSDEVYVNGSLIGKHEFRGVSLDPETKSFIPFGKKDPQLAFDPESEYLYYSDPLSLPKLQPRFYDIPESLLNADGDNEIKIVIKSYYQKAVSNKMDIRPVTTNRQEVGEYMKSGMVFSALRTMPMADLLVYEQEGALFVKNISETFAFSIIVDFIAKNSETATALSDNLFSLLPEESIELQKLGGGELEFPADIILWGWNVELKRFQLDVKGSNVSLDSLAVSLP